MIFYNENKCLEKIQISLGLSSTIGRTALRLLGCLLLEFLRLEIGRENSNFHPTIPTQYSILFITFRLEALFEVEVTVKKLSIRC